MEKYPASSPKRVVNNRIIVIDDNDAIHEDFAKILTTQDTNPELDAAEAAFFGEEAFESATNLSLDLSFAHQGEEGRDKVAAAAQSGRPFALAFVDMRMPPGWDGLKTIQELWKVDSEIQVVICTAYSDHTWADLCNAVGNTDKLLILKKPFDNIEVCQLALALTEKWTLSRQAKLNQQELERAVEEATSKLREAEKLVRQKQKMESLGSMVGGVAHEFNNLLQVIRGYTEFAMCELGPDSQPFEDLKYVMDTTDRAAAITDQMLRFGRQKLSCKAVVSANEIVESSLHLIKPMIGEQIELSVSLSNETLATEVDSNVLSQVLLNLCINARDAMDSQGQLSIFTQHMELTEDACVPGQVTDECLSAGKYAVIGVSDTGTGIPPEVRERIFEPFFTTKDVGKGTGLGLAVAYGAIQEHAGLLSVESKVGKGTTFRIILPISVVKQIANEQSTEVVPPQRYKSAGNQTILVAEDEQLVREVAVRVLESADYQVLVASDGQEAIDLFNQNSDVIDCVMLDAKMPSLSGQEVYEQIRRVDDGMNVLFCTGFDPDTSKMDLEHPCTFLAQKPVSPSALLGHIREMLPTEEARLEVISSNGARRVFGHHELTPEMAAQE